MLSTSCGKKMDEVRLPGRVTFAAELAVVAVSPLVAGRAISRDGDTSSSFEIECNPAHAVAEGVCAGEFHIRAVSAACGTVSKEEVMPGLHFLCFGIGGGGYLTLCHFVVILVRIIGTEGYFVRVIVVDNIITRRVEIAVSIIRHIGDVVVRGTTGTGNADAVAFIPFGSVRSADTGSGGHVVTDSGSKLGGHGAVVQVLDVVGAGGKRDAQNCESK